MYEYLVIYRHTYTHTHNIYNSNSGTSGPSSFKLETIFTNICHILHYCILACLPKQKEGSYFEFLETIYPTTSCNIPSDLNLHQHTYDKLKNTMWHIVPWTFILPCDLQDLILPPHEKNRLLWDMNIKSEIKMNLDVTVQNNNQTSFTRTTFTDWYHNGMHAFKRFLRNQPLPKKEEARQLPKSWTQCACWLSLNEGLMVKIDLYCLHIASPSLHWIVLYITGLLTTFVS